MEAEKERKETDGKVFGVSFFLKGHWMRQFTLVMLTHGLEKYNEDLKVARINMITYQNLFLLPTSVVCLVLSISNPKGQIYEASHAKNTTATMPRESCKLAEESQN
ncbi:Uncharacterized protein TCM_041876 [Theobroma cacao]|uniref:Uncharacterized protein n=1 Tax=Theobroma cacao TaxID=3641 RepID=A0A061H035_THECC|nr:Uncharacterized protein TCM_041876 [Theobroma cacao]